MEKMDLNEVVFADLHIHGPYSAGSSKKTKIEDILLTSNKIGLNVVGTGDILQPNWFRYLQDKLNRTKESSYQYNNEEKVHFLLSGEIEDAEGIHLLFLLPDFETASELRKKIMKKATNEKNLNAGRPIVKLQGYEIIELVHELNGLIGSAHSFTPFKSIFRENKYDNVTDFYKSSREKFDFIELGLSANSTLADKIRSLWDYPFLSNSDCHSPLPGKLGREFNILKLDTISFNNIRNALRKRKNNRIVGNVGLDPRLGKYYRSFCYKCRRRVYFGEKDICNETTLTIKSTNLIETLAKIKDKKIRCKCCRGLIKLGVLDRIKYIATTSERNLARPPYYNTVPLIEIIRIILNLKQQYTKKTINYYEELIKKLGTEIDILLMQDLSKIRAINRTLAKVIELLRKNKLPIVEGGGGHYGYLDAEKIKEEKL